MTLTIGQYIEALTSPDGRWRSLRRLRPLFDETGEPIFSLPGHGLVDFEVMALGKRYTLRCPLRNNPATAARLRELARKDHGLGSHFFTGWRILEGEAVLYGADETPFEVEILARPTPEGMPLVDFVRLVAEQGDTAAAKAALISFGEMTGWLRSIGRSGVSRPGLLVTPAGSVSLAAFSAVDETELIRNMLRAGASGDGHADREAGGRYFPDEPGRVNEADIRCVRDGGGWMYVDRPGRTVIDTVWLSAEPFRSGRAEVETCKGKGLIDIRGNEVLPAIYEELVWDDYWGVATVMVEGGWELVDRDGTIITTDKYDWLGECSEGLILARKGDKCGFLDTAGREVIPFVYDDASSFCEGCAPVTLGQGSFFIDHKGNRI